MVITMVYLVPLFMITIAYLVGSLFQKVIREKQGIMAETCLVGTCVILLLWEAVILPSIKLLAPFTVVCKFYGGILLLLVVLAVLFCGKDMRKQLKVREIWKPETISMVAVVIALQFLYLCFVYPDSTEDFTVETVYTTLDSNLIYENHPGMGRTFTYGITFRGKLVSLPLFYAYLATVFSGEVPVLVYRSVPFWGILLSYFGYYLWANILFGKEEKKREKTMVFLGGIGLLNLSGSFSGAGIFYNQMARGFRGETLLFAVFVPFGIYLCYQIYVNKRYHGIVYLLLGLLTSFCITDVQKGFVPMLFSVLICSLVMVGFRVGRWIRCRK